MHISACSKCCIRWSRSSNQLWEETLMRSLQSHSEVWVHLIASAGQTHSAAIEEVWWWWCAAGWRLRATPTGTCQSSHHPVEGKIQEGISLFSLFYITFVPDPQLIVHQESFCHSCSLTSNSWATQALLGVDGGQTLESQWMKMSIRFSLRFFKVNIKPLWPNFNIFFIIS